MSEGQVVPRAKESSVTTNFGKRYLAAFDTEKGASLYIERTLIALQSRVEMDGRQIFDAI